MADAGSNPLITSLLSLRELHKRQREYALGKLQYERDVSTARDRQEAVDRVQEERALLQEERDRLRRQLLAVERDLAESRRLEASMMSWKEEADQQVRSTQSRLCGPLKDAVDAARAQHHLPKLPPPQREWEGNMAAYLETRRRADMASSSSPSSSPIPQATSENGPVRRPRGRPRGVRNGEGRGRTRRSKR
ncbi:MAG: hypothetical protein DHS80DRAFT_33103 [Piptocephalis tieghemiana]|nr:MAG: hypothetical protein DHS80DRAFT_33103 [Piptocephalis tieghemiana]